MKKLNNSRKAFNENKEYKNRIMIISCIGLILFIIIIYRLINMIIINRNYYEKKLYSLTNVVTSNYSSPRGRIYDRNYKLLVDSKSINNLVFKKENNMNNKNLIDNSYLISKHLDLNYNKVGEYALKEFWSLLNEDKFNNKINKDEINKLYSGELSNNDIYNLKRSRITEGEINSLSDSDRKASYIYYLMNNGYSYDEKVIKKDLSDSEYAYFSENSILGFSVKEDYERLYLYGDTFKTILGSINQIPMEEKSSYLKKGYSINDVVGTSYLEYQYEDILKPEKDKYKVISSNKKELISKGKRGKDIVLTIDIELQKKLEEVLSENILATKKEPNTKYYNKSFAVITDPKTGEILAMSGKKAVKEDGKYKIIDYSAGLLTNPMTPGSVVKGASILVGYNTNAIKIGEYMVDECIKVSGTTKKCSWKKLGRINDIKAIAMSSNVYQFKTAMRVAGYKGYSYNMKFFAPQKAFDLYRNMYHSFGLGVKTNIDLPIESLGYSGKDNQSGLLLDFVMGQYETYTPIQLSQYISTIANDGVRLKPHLLKEVHDSSSNNKIGDKLYNIKTEILNKVDTKEEYFKRMQDGLYAVCNASYGIGHNYIDKKYNPAGKTGTSESFLDTDLDGIIDTETISTAFIGYAPYKDPKISITITSPDISYKNSSYNYMSYVNKKISKTITDYYFENNN